MNKHAWSDGLITVLHAIRKNSISLSKYHKKRYMKYKGYAKYFKIPLIVLSGINSVIAVGLQVYLPQQFISIISCILSLVCAIITSVELYLGIQKTMENEMIASKDFYLLAVDIFKMTSLPPQERLVNGRAFLDDKYQAYCKLVENSDVVIKQLVDNLVPVQHDPCFTSSASGGSVLSIEIAEPDSPASSDI
jgi:hypothetical protein